MPSPCASAGTMYLFSEGAGASVMSVEHKAAVDGQQLSGDEARALAQQEDHRARHIVGMLQALHGPAGDIMLPAFFGHVFGRLDLYQSRRDRVDGNIVGTEFARQRACRSEERR